MTTDHQLVIEKSRYKSLNLQDEVIDRPDRKLGEKILNWFSNNTVIEEDEPLENGRDNIPLQPDELPEEQTSEEIFNDLQNSPAEVEVPTDPKEIRVAFQNFCKERGIIKIPELQEFSKQYGFKSDNHEYLAQWLKTPDKLEVVIKEFLDKKAA